MHQYEQITSMIIGKLLIRTEIYKGVVNDAAKIQQICNNCSLLDREYKFSSSIRTKNYFRVNFQHNRVYIVKGICHCYNKRIQENTKKLRYGGVWWGSLKNYLY